jgi:hypothetical protein
MENPFWGSLCLRWLGDTVIGQLPLSEVWASDEIVRPKLAERDSSTEADRLLNNSENPPDNN